MIMTIVEGAVPEAKQKEFEASYKILEMPAGMLYSFLLQDRSKSEKFRLIAVWESIEALKEMQESHPIPPGILIFREIGSEPEVHIFDVIYQRETSV